MIDWSGNVTENAKITDEQLDSGDQLISPSRNNMTRIDAQSSTYDGISYSTYRNQIRKEMLIRMRNNENVRRTAVTILPQEVDALAKQVGNWHDASTELNLVGILSHAREPNV